MSNSVALRRTVKNLLTLFLPKKYSTLNEMFHETLSSKGQISTTPHKFT